MAISEKAIVEVLRDSGLTDRESEVYLFLAKTGIQKGGEISKAMRMHKAQAYRILKKLQTKGMVQSTLEFPTRFEAIPFDEILDMLIKSKREQASFLEYKRSEILDHWRSIKATKSTELEKFVILEGRSNVFSKAFQMTEEAENEFLGVTISVGAIQANQGALTAAARKRNIRIRGLTDVSEENIEALREMIDDRSVNVEVRHIDLSHRYCPRFMIKDGEEAVFLTTPKYDPAGTMQELTGLWTNSKAFVYALKVLFDELWFDATDIRERISELEKEKPEGILIRSSD